YVGHETFPSKEDEPLQEPSHPSIRDARVGARVPRPCSPAASFPTHELLHPISRFHAGRLGSGTERPSQGRCLGAPGERLPDRPPSAWGDQSASGLVCTPPAWSRGGADIQCVRPGSATAALPGESSIPSACFPSDLQPALERRHAGNLPFIPHFVN